MTTEATNDVNMLLFCYFTFVLLTINTDVQACVILRESVEEL